MFYLSDMITILIQIIAFIKTFNLFLERREKVQEREEAIVKDFPDPFWLRLVKIHSLFLLSLNIFLEFVLCCDCAYQCMIVILLEILVISVLVGFGHSFVTNLLQTPLWKIKISDRRSKFISLPHLFLLNVLFWLDFQYEQGEYAINKSKWTYVEESCFIPWFIDSSTFTNHRFTIGRIFMFQRRREYISTYYKVNWNRFKSIIESFSSRKYLHFISETVYSVASNVVAELVALHMTTVSFLPCWHLSL